MKKRRIALILFCALMLLLLALQVAVPHPQTPEQSLAQPISAGNADNVSRLLNDLVKAHRSLAAEDMRQIDADLEAIRAVDGRDYEIAKAVAEHWRKVYLDPDYELCLYRGEEKAEVLRDFGIEDSPAHAFVVLGYELMDGEMQPELMSRCDAAAAAARAFPSTILVCSGGATGANNPQGHTEAGRMKAYLTERCGIEASRIFIDEQAMTTAENAVNTFEILRREGVRTMTIVTSDYHQRWGQALYNAVGALYRQRTGYSAEIAGNYCCEIENTRYQNDDQIAAMQIAGILQLSGGGMYGLPRP